MISKARYFVFGSFDIIIFYQASNVPDYNVLNLLFFIVIWSLQRNLMAECFEELVSVAKESFDLYVRKTAINVFLARKTVCEGTLPVNGGNIFKGHHGRETILQMLKRNTSTQLDQMAFISQCANTMKKFMINFNIFCYVHY